jgi:hypothetical protein
MSQELGKGYLCFFGGSSYHQDGSPIKIIATLSAQRVIKEAPGKLYLLGGITSSEYVSLERGLYLFFGRLRRSNTEWFDIDISQVRKVLDTWDNLMDVDGESEKERCTRFLNMLKI